MQQHKQVEDYLNSVIPEKIADSTKAELRAELESHIYDKAEFYMEIGYDEQSAFTKAVEEMGEAEPVKEEFDGIYREKGIFAIITFISIHILDLVAALIGFGGAVFWLMMIDSKHYLDYSYETLLISSGFICAVLILIAYCYKEKKIKMLKAIAVSNLLFSIFPWFSCSLYYPFAYRLLDLFFETAFSDVFVYFSSEIVSIPLCIISFVLFLVAKNKKSNIQSYRKKERIFRTISVCLILCFGLFIALHTLSISNEYEYYNYSVISEYNLKKENKKYTEKESDIFDYINNNMSYEQVDVFLRQRGYVPHTEFYKYIENEEELEYQLGYMKERMVNADNDILYINLSQHKTPWWSLSSIVIPKTQDSTVPYKKFNYDYDSLNLDKGKNSKEDFKALNKGDEKETVLKLMNKSYALESKKVEYEEDKPAETYYFSSNYDNGDLFFSDYTNFDAELIFKDSVLMQGNCHSLRYYENEDHEIIEETEDIVIE